MLAGCVLASSVSGAHWFGFDTDGGESVNEDIGGGGVPARSLEYRSFLATVAIATELSWEPPWHCYFHCRLWSVHGLVDEEEKVVQEEARTGRAEVIREREEWVCKGLMGFSSKRKTAKFKIP